MTALGSVELNIDELPGELQIRYSRHAGWIERIVAPAAVPILMVTGWFLQKPALILVASFLLVLLILRWAWGKESILRIFPDRLIASSYLSNSTETLLANVESIQWLGRWGGEGDGGPDGLYISCAGKPKCILPFISKERASAVIDAIFRRFPAYPINLPIPGSIWFDNRRPPWFPPNES